MENRTYENLICKKRPQLPVTYVPKGKFFVRLPRKFTPEQPDPQLHNLKEISQEIQKVFSKLPLSKSFIAKKSHSLKQNRRKMTDKSLRTHDTRHLPSLQNKLALDRIQKFYSEFHHKSKLLLRQLQENLN